MLEILFLFWRGGTEENCALGWPDHRCGHVSVSQGLLVIQIEICGQFLKFIALPFTEILKHKLTDKFNFVKNVKFYFKIIKQEFQTSTHFFLILVTFSDVKRDLFPSLELTKIKSSWNSLHSCKEVKSYFKDIELIRPCALFDILLIYLNCFGKSLIILCYVSKSKTNYKQEWNALAVSGTLNIWGNENLENWEEEWIFFWMKHLNCWEVNY